MRSEFWKNHFSDNKTGSERQSLEDGDPLEAAVKVLENGGVDRGHLCGKEEDGP